MDELKEALHQQDISQEQFALAISTASEIKSGLLSDVRSLINYTNKCYEMLVQ